MRGRRLFALVLVTAAGAVTFGAAAAARDAARALEASRSELAGVQEGAAEPAAARAALRRASEDVRRARAELDAWPVDVVAAVPVLGRSWVAERAVARTADEVITGGLVLADGLPTVRATAGGVDLDALQRVHSRLSGPARRSRAAFAELTRTPVGLTPPPVGRGVSAASDELGPAVQALERAEQGLSVAVGLLGGSGRRSVLIALQNNAELRGAGGYVSTFGTGRLERGRLVLDPLRDVRAVADPPERAHKVPAPAEFTQDYGFLSADTTIWRSWNMSPHVPDSALVGARVAGVLLGEQPDVVVLLDVPAMGALAGLGSEAVVLPNGSEVEPSELTDALLVDAYAAAGGDEVSQVQRRADLRAAAAAAVGRLLTGELPAADVLRTLTGLAAGRHLSIWSARPAEQQLLIDLGVAGAVTAPPGGDLSHVSVNNVGANKLDVYAQRRLAVDVRLDEDEDEASVVQRVSLTNAAPAGLVPYVAGPRAGTTVNRIELSLPPSAAQVRATVDGRPWPGTTRRGLDRQRMTARVELPRGAGTVLEVRYRLPLRDGRYRLRVVPQPLVEDASFSLSVRRVDDGPLSDVAGAEVVDGRGVVEPATPLSRTREVSVSLDGGSGRRATTWWDRLQDFWSSPVRLG